MTLTGLRIDLNNLALIIGREDLGRRAKGAHPSLKTISEHDIESTREQYPKCKCEHHGLVAGMTLDSLNRLGAGCTPDWICPRLDTIRRMNGH